LWVTGVISNLPRSTLTGTRFVLDVDEAWLGAQRVPVPPRLSLGWYRGVDEDALLGGPAEELRAGQRWRLPVRLRRPHGSSTRTASTWSCGSSSRASAPAATCARGLAPARCCWPRTAGHPAAPAPGHPRRIRLRVADPAAAGVLAALAVGDQQAIDRADWDVFRATGVAHLMAISGLARHDVRLAGRPLVGRPVAPAVHVRCCWCPRRRRRAGAAVLAALAYALLAGWGVPAQRTVWMLATGGAAAQPWPALALAAGAAGRGGGW
jgi:competence protein ComEC